MLNRFALFSIYTQTEKERNVHVCRFEVPHYENLVRDMEYFGRGNLYLAGGGGS